MNHENGVNVVWNLSVLHQTCQIVDILFILSETCTRQRKLNHDHRYQKWCRGPANSMRQTMNLAPNMVSYDFTHNNSTFWYIKLAYKTTNKYVVPVAELWSLYFTFLTFVSGKLKTNPIYIQLFQIFIWYIHATNINIFATYLNLYFCFLLLLIFFSYNTNLPLNIFKTFSSEHSRLLKSHLGRYYGLVILTSKLVISFSLFLVAMNLGLITAISE